MKKFVLGVGLVVFLAGCQPQVKQAPLPVPTEKPEVTAVPARPVEITPGKDPKNASYVIEGEVVTLVNGKAETPAAPGSASMVTTTMFGEPTKGELTGGAKTDAAVLLVRDTGGSGTFYYQAAAINGADGYTGTNAILLGDQIAPQTTEIREFIIIANYAERAEGEPMTAQPSVGVSKYFEVKGEVLVEVDQPQGQM